MVSDAEWDAFLVSLGLDPDDFTDDGVLPANRPGGAAQTVNSTWPSRPLFDPSSTASDGTRPLDALEEEEEPEEKVRFPQLRFDPVKSRPVQTWRFGHGTHMQ